MRISYIANKGMRMRTNSWRNLILGIAVYRETREGRNSQRTRNKIRLPGFQLNTCCMQGAWKLQQPTREQQGDNQCNNLYVDQINRQRLFALLRVSFIFLLWLILLITTWRSKLPGLVPFHDVTDRDKGDCKFVPSGSKHS